VHKSDEPTQPEGVGDIGLVALVQERNSKAAEHLKLKANHFPSSKRLFQHSD